MLIKISTSELDLLKTQAKQSQRMRKNFNFHKHPDDLLQRMLHAMNPGTYVQPHKHETSDKREVFILLEGKVAVVEFDDAGAISSFIILSHETGNFGVEIPERTWHMLIALEENSVVYEVKDGPYSPAHDKDFATWAPKEGEPECTEYLSNLRNQIKP